MRQPKDLMGDAADEQAGDVRETARPHHDEVRTLGPGGVHDLFGGVPRNGPVHVAVQ